MAELMIARPNWRRGGVLLAVLLAPAAVCIPVSITQDAWQWAIPGVVVAAFVVWLVVRATVANSATATPEGLTIRSAYDRAGRLVPWSAIRAVWIAPAGRYDYLLVLPDDVEATLAQAPRLRTMHQLYGAPFRVELALDTEQVLDAVRASSEVEILPGRPEPGKEEPRTLAAVAPRTIRPSRRLLIPAALVALAGVAVLVFGWWLADLFSPLYLGIYLIAWALVIALRATLLRVKLSSRELTGGMRMTWDSITAIERCRVGPWEWLRVQRYPAPVNLPAPRSLPLGRDPRFEEHAAAIAEAWAARGGTGTITKARSSGSVAALLPVVAIMMPLLFGAAAMLVFVDKPWNKPYWPGVQLAATTPDPCAAVSPARREPLVGNAPARRSSFDVDADDTDRTCEFETERGSVEVEFHRFTYDYGDSVADAKERLDSYTRIYLANDAPERAVAGLGDQALVETFQSRRVISSTVLVRRANMIVRISYRGELEQAAAEAAVLAAAREATAAIRLR